MSKSHWQKAKETCARKASYQSRAVAKWHLRDLRDRGEKKVRIYRCPIDDFGVHFHIGHRSER